MELTELVIKFQAGDEAAFEALYEGSYKKVYYFLLNMTKSPEYAQDIAQETFLEMYKSLGTLKNPEAFSPWLMQIASNKAKRYMQKTNAQPVLLTQEQEELYESTPDPKEELLPESLVQDSESRKLLMNIINGLPDTQRESVMMFYFSEMPVEKIAEIMGCSEGTVKSRLNYARQKLKTGILTLEEKEGIRLHGLVPVALLLSKAAEEMPDVSAFMPSWQTISTAATGVAAGAAGAAGAGSRAVKGGIFASIKAKIVASVAAVAVIAGAGTVIANLPEEIHLDNPELEYNIRVLVDKPEGKLTVKDVENIEMLVIYNGGIDDNFGAHGMEDRLNPAKGTKALLSLKDISKLPRLRTLKFADEQERLLYDIEVCENIENFFYFNYDVQDFHLKDFSVLDKFPNLQYVRLGASANSDTSYLKNCEQLRILGIKYVGQEDYDVTLDISGLNKLQLFNCFSFNVSDIKLIYSGTYPELRVLEFPGINLGNLEFLYAAPNLEYLELGSAAPYAMDFVGSLTKLRAMRLFIFNEGDVYDFAPLENCKSLEAISYDGALAELQYINIPQGVKCYKEDYMAFEEEPAMQIRNEIMEEVYNLLR